ncbi:MAG: type IX secretion system membrane protein PorP/SprF [Bacteroidota bacterium]
MRRIFLFALCSGLLILPVAAQQYFQNSLSNYTQYGFNPAAVSSRKIGMQEGSYLTLLGRLQWLGLPQGPQTSYLSYETFLPDNAGYVGGRLMVDAQGPLSVTWLEGSYAFGFDIGVASKLRIGASAGIKQFTLDGTQLNPAELGDVVIPQSMVGTAVPALSTGVYLTGNYPGTRATITSLGSSAELRYFAGFSIQNLLEPSIENILLTPNSNNLESRDERTFILSGGYNFKLDTRMRLMPSVTIMTNGVSLPQASLSALWSYDPISVGLTYRRFDQPSVESVGLILGVNVNTNLTVTYAYDYPLLSLNGNGDINSHELVITYLIKAGGGRNAPKEGDILKKGDGSSF